MNAVNLQHQAESLTVRLHTAPNDSRPVYLVGSFNDWNPADPDYLLRKTGQDTFEYRFAKAAGLTFPLEYKFTRGGWDNVELDEYGNETGNRVLHNNPVEIHVEVVRWSWNGLFYNPRFLPKIHILSEAFEIPQLIKTRRITALLPHDYYESNRRYPVLYLQDGQNLFDDYAPFGSWGVDKKLAVLAEKGLHELIVIAIDHAQEERVKEFTPSYQTRLGRGDGKKYLRFLVETLKPHIDSHFRTKTERSATGIGGSSMGGLISIYAGFLYPEVYGKLLIFSPSLWVEPNIHFQGINLHGFSDTRMYLYGGGEEGASMLPNLQRLKAALEAQNVRANLNFHLSYDPTGKHNEARWGEEFPRAIKWLYFDSSNP